MNATQIEITLQLEAAGGTVAGRARANGETHTFAGRIGLLALIDSLLEGGQTEGPRDNNTDGDRNADS